MSLHLNLEIVSDDKSVVYDRKCRKEKFRVRPFTCYEKVWNICAATEVRNLANMRVIYSDHTHDKYIFLPTQTTTSNYLFVSYLIRRYASEVLRIISEGTRTRHQQSSFIVGLSSAGFVYSQVCLAFIFP